MVVTQSQAQREERANDRQVGGSHYQKGDDDQHWDIVDRHGVPYLEGVGSKYPLRWREKGGLEDLRKTLHYIDKILESPDTHPRWDRCSQQNGLLAAAAGALCERHRCGGVEHLVVMRLLCGVGRSTLQHTRAQLSSYIDQVARAEELSQVAPAPGTPEDGGHHARQSDEDEEARSISVPLEVSVTHVHLHLPEGCSGNMQQVGETLSMRWGRT